MPLQDLTPQLRTRLNRAEQIVGWFMIAAVVLVVVGFGYFLYRTAEQRGWFEVQAPFCTYADTGEGLAVGDPVKLMGFSVGRITDIAPMPPRGKGSDHNVLIRFVVVGANYAYVSTGNSRAQFVDNGFIGKRLDITKGTKGYSVYMNFPTRQMSLDDIQSSAQAASLRLGQEVYDGSNLLFKAWGGLKTNIDNLRKRGLTDVWAIDTTDKRKRIESVWNDAGAHYEPFYETNVYILTPDEPPALMDRVQGIVAQVEKALPNILSLTNQIAATLANSERLTSNLDAVAAGLRPAVSDVAVITANLRNPRGSLGEWLLPTNVNNQLTVALTNANGALVNVNTNLDAIFDGVGQSLDNLAAITSNLDRQVQVNSNMLSQISSMIVDSDTFIEGLKRHWLLRSAFRHSNTNAPSTPPERRERER